MFTEAPRAADRRAWVRKPVWATMRWSGRTDWPSMCQVRCSTSSVSACRTAIRERLAELADLDDRRRVGDEDAARAQRPLGVLHDLPRLGQVEHDAVEVGLVDALVAVAQLDAVARRALGAEEATTFLARSVGEVVAQLVADDLGARPRSSVIDSAPEPTPDSSTRAPGKMSASIRIGPRSFG